jgi:subtilase family serine protease
VQLPAVAAGSYQLLVVADAINYRVHEADASNNVRAVPLTVGTADLVVSALTGPTSVGAQSSATVTLIVTNQGSAARRASTCRAAPTTTTSGPTSLPVDRRHPRRR